MKTVHSVMTTLCIFIAALAFAVPIGSAEGEKPPEQPSAPDAAAPFTYQGQLQKNDQPVDDTCSMAFRLYDAQIDGSLVGTPVTITVPVNDGLFTQVLDFGSAAFPGGARFLETRVKCTGEAVYTDMGRHPLTPVPYAVNADLLDNHDTAFFQQRVSGLCASGTAIREIDTDGSVTCQAVSSASYEHVIIVAKSGGDFTTITAALDSISDNDADNRYLIWIAPGDYFEKVTMKAYVDIEGAGKNQTKIVSNGGNSITSAATLVGASEAEIRFLTIESNVSGDSYATAIYNNSSGLRQFQISASAYGGSDLNTAIYNTASATMTYVTAEGTGGSIAYGVYNNNCSPVMINVIATGKDGTDTNYGVLNQDSSPMMTGVSATGSGGNVAYGVKNSDSSLTMSDGTVSAENGATSTFGIYNHESELSLLNVIVEASGTGSVSSGLFNASSDVMIMGSSISASGSTACYGVANSSTDTVIQNSTIKAAGGGTNYGTKDTTSTGSYQMKITNSQIISEDNTVSSSAYTTVLIGSTLLDGGPVSSGGGTATCAGVYDESFTFYASTCP